MLLVVLLAVVGAGVALALGEKHEEGSFYGWRPHLPETADEKAAAATATAYVRAVLGKRADRACGLAAGENFRKLHCARKRPRTDDVYLYAHDPKWHVYDVSLRGDHAGVEFTGIAPGPGHEIVLERIGGVWRVVRDYGFGRA